MTHPQTTAHLNLHSLNSPRMKTLHYKILSEVNARLQANAKSYH